MSDNPYSFLQSSYQVVSRVRPFSVEKTIHREDIVDLEEAERAADELFATGKYARVSVETPGGSTKYEAGGRGRWVGARTQAVTSIAGLADRRKPGRYKRK